jgi:hypothetical protein
MALDEAKNPVKGVSGPGKFSSRTDLPPSSSYGEGVQNKAIAGGAPIASTPDVRGATNTQMRQAAARGQGQQAQQSQGKQVGLYDPSQKPDEPITAGINRGAGPGSEALVGNMPTGKLSDTLAVLLPYDQTGEITVLYQNALARGQ